MRKLPLQDPEQGVPAQRDHSAPSVRTVGQRWGSLPNSWSWPVLILVFASGMILGLTLAPSPLWGVAWIAIIPLWVGAVQSRTWKQAACLGGVWGLGYHGAALAWVLGLHPLTWLGMSWGTSVAIATFSWVAVTVWGAGLPLLWAIALWRLKSILRGGSRLIVGATLWCGLEWIWGQSPLWWTALENSQSPRNLAILHLSQLSGPVGITLALVLVNGALSEAVLHRPKQWLTVALLLFAGLHGLGWELAQQTLLPPSTQALSIGILQGNIPTRFKLSPSGIRQAVQRYSQGYRTLAAQGADAVLMPEGALPFLWGNFPKQEQVFLKAIEETGVPLWLGTFFPTESHYTQSLLSLQANGTVLSRYDKVKLVPLGEYLPFAEQLEPILQRLSPVALQMRPGSRHQTFHTPLGQAIVGICYDSVFSDLFRAQAATGGEFILSVANNDPFGDRMMAQHHAIDVLRAIETDRWLVRATNTGLSAVINPHGQTLWQSTINQPVTHLAHIERRFTRTPYVQWGNWLLPVLVVGSVGLTFKALPLEPTFPGR